MNEPRVIKFITPSICPHCNKEIIVSSKMVSPMVDWILKKEDVEKAKNDLREQVEKIKFKDENEQKATTVGPIRRTHKERQHDKIHEIN